MVAPWGAAGTVGAASTDAEGRLAPASFVPSDKAMFVGVPTMAAAAEYVRAQAGDALEVRHARAHAGSNRTALGRRIPPAESRSRPIRARSTRSAGTGTWLRAPRSQPRRPVLS